MNYTSRSAELTAVTFIFEDETGGRDEKTVIFEPGSGEYFISVPESAFAVVSALRAAEVAYVICGGQVYAPFKFLRQIYADDPEVIASLDCISKQAKEAMDSGLNEFTYADGKLEGVA